jgi:hypothetical protein
MQFLLNADGSVPPGTNLVALTAAGVRLVHPTTPPVAAPGMLVRDTIQPQEIDGVWWQVWEQVPLPIVDDLQNLSQSQFTFLLSISGLDDLWTTLETTLKPINTQLYATLRGSRFRESFRFDETLKLVGLFSPYLPEGSPQITREFLEPLWVTALKF